MDKILAAGQYQTEDKQASVFVVYRFHAKDDPATSAVVELPGELDTSFGPDGNGIVRPFNLLSVAEDVDGNPVNGLIDSGARSIVLQPDPLGGPDRILVFGDVWDQRVTKKGKKETIRNTPHPLSEMSQRMGIHISASCMSGGSKPGGMTPRTVHGLSLRMSSEPTTAGSAPSEFRQKPSPKITVSGAPGRSSSGKNPRPKAGETCNTSENMSWETEPSTTCTGSVPACGCTSMRS